MRVSEGKAAPARRWELQSWVMTARNATGQCLSEGRLQKEMPFRGSPRRRTSPGGQAGLGSPRQTPEPHHLCGVAGTQASAHQVEDAGVRCPRSSGTEKTVVGGQGSRREGWAMCPHRDHNKALWAGMPGPPAGAWTGVRCAGMRSALAGTVLEAIWKGWVKRRLLQSSRRLTLSLCREGPRAPCS